MINYTTNLWSSPDSLWADNSENIGLMQLMRILEVEGRVVLLDDD